MQPSPELLEQIDRDMNTVLVDFDHTICDTEGLFKMRDPIPGAREALQALKDMGLRVVIWSCRTTPSEFKPWSTCIDAYNEIMAWMDEHDLPFDMIYLVRSGKPGALCTIDNRNIAFRGQWDGIVEQVKEFKDEWDRTGHGES